MSNTKATRKTTNKKAQGASKKAKQVENEEPLQIEETTQQEKEETTPKENDQWLDKELGDIIQTMDEEQENEEGEEDVDVDVSDLPVITKPTKKSGTPAKGRVIFLGHLPYGFFEDQMKEFFSQFGEVKRVTIARSPKTGNLCQYGFVEFTFAEVAQIVVDTMNDYLLFKKRLVCKHVSGRTASKINWNASNIPVVPYVKIQAKNAELFNNRKRKTPEQALNQLKDKERKFEKKMKKHNINYEFDGYAQLKQQIKSIPKKDEEEVNKEADKAEKEVWQQRKQAKMAEVKALQQKAGKTKLQAKANKTKSKKTKESK